MRIFVVAILWGLGLLSGACAKSASSEIGTSEIWASYVVSGNSADTVTCSATFRVGGALGTYLELTKDDAVFCDDGTNTVEMTKSTDLLNMVEYSTSGVSYLPDHEYKLVFKRSSSESYESTVTLPAAVVVTAPVTGTNHTKGTALDVAWTPGVSEAVQISLAWMSGGRAGSTSHQDSADGTDTFTGTETLTADGQGTLIGSAPATVSVERRLSGTVSTGIKGGSIRGTQTKTVSFTLVD